MARTRITQSILIYSSDTYDDTIAPTLAAYETNTINIEEDLNNVRSMLSYLKDVQAGNWYDTLVVPSALETGTARGIDNLNTALHAVEKQRVLNDVHNLTDVTVPASVGATGTLTAATNFANNDTVTIGSKVYTFQTTLTNVDGNIQIGATVALSHENLRRAINLDGVAGTNYAAAMTIHPTVSATDTATTTIVTAKVTGTAGNTIATTETGANSSWAAATLTGGTGDVVILGTGELPSNTTAAVGAVTTLGTVVAAHGGTFGEHALSEVTGANAINPKNLCLIVDGDTRDPILSDSRQVWALLQGESGVTDGATITDSTATRVQLSFVRINATGDDLEAVPGADIGGLTINYCNRERFRLQNLTEESFLRGAIVDVAGGTTSDLQSAYDTQGTVPVDQTTNATLDLEGPGLAWSIRDDLQATLFSVTEGSAGGTSTVTLGSDVDVFNNDALANDFATGATINSSGTRPIAIGETDGVIGTTAGDLAIDAFAELLLDDGNRGASTYSTAVKLSDTSAEWDDFETAFGEVSLLDAIVQASTIVNRTRVQAVCTADIAADADVNGATSLGGGANLDVDLPAYDQVTFLTDVDVYVDGVLLRNGANAAANNDVYPGTSAALGDLRFEMALKGTGSKPDTVTVIVYGQ
ncbi:hypothetical protein OAF54_03165 [bacterium]|nr:hypothetical protein [bacterium]